MNSIHTVTNWPTFGLEDILQTAVEFIDGIDIDPSHPDGGYDHPFGRTCPREMYDAPESEEEEDDP